MDENKPAMDLNPKEKCPKCSDLFYDPHMLIANEKDRAKEWEEMYHDKARELEDTYFAKVKETFELARELEAKKEEARSFEKHYIDTVHELDDANVEIDNLKSQIDTLTRMIARDEKFQIRDRKQRDEWKTIAETLFEKVNNYHSSGHTMGWGPCQMCDALLEYKNSLKINEE